MRKWLSYRVKCIFFLWIHFILFRPVQKQDNSLNLYSSNVTSIVIVTVTNYLFYINYVGCEPTY